MARLRPGAMVAGNMINYPETWFASSVTGRVKGIWSSALSPKRSDHNHYILPMMMPRSRNLRGWLPGWFSKGSKVYQNILAKIAIIMRRKFLLSDEFVLRKQKSDLLSDEHLSMHWIYSSHTINHISFANSAKDRGWF